MKCEWMKRNYLKRYCGQTVVVNEEVADRNQDGMTEWRKTQGNWVVEIGGRKSRMEVAGGIRLSRPRISQGCTADDDNVMFRHYRVILKELVINTLPSYTSISNVAVGNTICN